MSRSSDKSRQRRSSRAASRPFASNAVGRTLELTLGLTFGLTLIAAAVLAPLAADAQEVSVRQQAMSRGWIGISYAVRAESAGDGDVNVTAVVTEVSDDGPAAGAGVMAGDTILEVNGRPVAGSTFADLALEPGDHVELRIRRDGRERTFELKAAERPAGLGRIRIPSDVVVRVDSINTAIFRSLADSSSVRFFRTEPGTRVIVMGDSVIRRSVADSLGRAERFFLPPPMVRLAPLDSATGGRVSTWTLAESFWPDRQPFNAFVLRSERTDSIMSRMAGVKAELDELRRAELQRQRALAEDLEEEQRRIDQNDPDLQRLRNAQVEVRERLEELERELAEASRQELRRRQADSEERALLMVPGVDSARAGPVTGTFRFRFPTPHVVGQSVVAGAQLVPLNEGLARYFQTDQGLLVAEVAPGSPAGQAGLEPGDVVTGMNGDPVSSIDGLRHMLSERDGPLILNVIRRGDSLEIELRK